MTLDEVTAVASASLKVLASDRKVSASFRGAIRSKDYWVYNSGPKTSRPYNLALFEPTPRLFIDEWDAFIGSLDRAMLTASAPAAKALYTAAMAFAICSDLYGGSNKAAGTYFERMIGTVHGDLLGARPHDKVPVPSLNTSVPTDIWFHTTPSRHDVIVSAKTSTRERIVQAYAHQAILNGVFGAGQYRSILIAAGEVQMAKPAGVSETCVPGQIEMYHKALAPLYGLYYLDQPFGYSLPAFATLVGCKPINALFLGDLQRIVSFGEPPMF